MSVDVIVTSLTLGLLSAASPCILPLYPGFLAYLSGAHEATGRRRGRYLLGFFVLAGVLTMMLILGMFIALISVSIGQALSIAIPIADLLIIALGIALLLNFNPFKRLPQIQVPLLSNPYANAFVYGLLYGPIALPCSGPLVVGIFTLSLTAGEALSKLGIFFWFGLGFGLPLLVLSFLSGAGQHWITRQFAQRARLINIIAGAILVTVGILDLWTNWDLIETYLG
ncbi:cytochrome c biogenesis CcdA family protein [Chloroflexota bacterium]